MQHGPRPSEAVLNVTELLENILLFLPISDLLRAQQVSRYFRETIIRSQCLQEALFLRSKNARLDQTALPELNPLFTHHAAVGYRSIGFPYKGMLYYMSQPQRTLDPNSTHFINEKGYGTWHLDISIQDLDPHLMNDTMPLHSVDDGSWKNMFMSNPPCSIQFKVWKTTDDGYAGVSGRGPLKRQANYKGRFAVLGGVNGPTFGRLVEQASLVLKNSCVLIAPSPAH